MPVPAPYITVNLVRHSAVEGLTSDESHFASNIEQAVQFELIVVMRACVVGSHVVFCVAL